MLENRKKDIIILSSCPIRLDIVCTVRYWVLSL